MSIWILHISNVKMTLFKPSTRWPFNWSSSYQPFTPFETHQFAEQSPSELTKHIIFYYYKAFDSISHLNWWEKCGLSFKLVSVIKYMYSNLKSFENL